MQRSTRQSRRSAAAKKSPQPIQPASNPIDEPPGRFRVDKWTRRLIRPLLVALMATSVSIALLVILQIVIPEQSWMSLWIVCFLVALETAYTTTWLAEPGSHGVDKFAYRAAEFVIILVVVRLFSWIFFGSGIPTTAELETIFAQPMTILATGGFLTSLFVALAAWIVAGALSETLSQLDLSLYEISYYSRPLVERKELMDDQPIQISRGTLVDRFVRVWLTGGTLLVFLAALSSFDIPDLVTETNILAVNRLGLHPAMLVALLFYFLCGFWLLSYARMSLMNARWLMNGVAKEANVERSWQRSSLIVLAAIALIAAFLPIGSTVLFSQIVAVLISVVLYLLRLLFVLLLAPIAWVLSLLGRDTQQFEELIEQPPPLQPPPMPLQEPPPPNEFVNLVLSSTFWTIIIVVTLAAFLFFLRERGYKLNWQTLRQMWQQATTWMRTMWEVISGRANQTQQALRLRFRSSKTEEAAEPGKGPRWRFVRLNSLSPQEQIRYFYLSTVRRAGEQGIKRQDSETPLEYVQDLKKSWPEAEEDLEDLTGAFIQARYSPRPIEKEEIIPVKARWKRVRSRLRKNR